MNQSLKFGPYSKIVSLTPDEIHALAQDVFRQGSAAGELNQADRARLALAVVALKLKMRRRLTVEADQKRREDATIRFWRLKQLSHDEFMRTVQAEIPSLAHEEEEKPEGSDGPP